MTDLGLRALEAARILLERKPREIPGPQHDPQILAILSGCRRGGTPVAGILDVTGEPLGLHADEDAWCAATASWELACAEPGKAIEAVPHGYRGAVHELVSDAKARGKWHGPSTRPELGWLAVWTRGGQDPVRGGKGHTGRVSRVGSDTFATIEGNVGNTMDEVLHTYVEADLRGWVET